MILEDRARGGDDDISKQSIFIVPGDIVGPPDRCSLQTQILFCYQGVLHGKHGHICAIKMFSMANTDIFVQSEGIQSQTFLLLQVQEYFYNQKEAYFRG